MYLSSSLPKKILRTSPDGPHTGAYQKLNKEAHHLTSLYTGDSNTLLRARIFGKNISPASQLPDKDLTILRNWLPYQLEVEYWIMKNLLPGLFQDVITRARQDVYAFIDKYALEPPSLYPNRVSVTLYPSMLHCFLQSTTDYVGGFRRGYETIMAIAKPDRTKAAVQTLYGILVHELVHAITYRYLEIYSEEDIEGRAFFMPKPVGEALTEILAHFIMTESLSKKDRNAYFRKLGLVFYQENIHLLFNFLSTTSSLKENGVGIVQFVKAMFSEAQTSRLELFLNKKGSSLNRVANPQTSEPIARAGGTKALETLASALRDPKFGLSTPGDSLIF